MKAAFAVPSYQTASYTRTLKKDYQSEKRWRAEGLITISALVRDTDLPTMWLDPHPVDQMLEGIVAPLSERD